MRPQNGPTMALEHFMNSKFFKIKPSNKLKILQSSFIRYGFIHWDSSKAQQESEKTSKIVNKWSDGALCAGE